MPVKMDYKDLVVTSTTFLGGAIGGTYGGPVGLVAGMVAGAGVASTWAYQTDLREVRLRQQP